MINTKVKNPSERGNGFIWALVILGLVIAAVIGYILFTGRTAQTNKVLDGVDVQEVAFDVNYSDNVISLVGKDTTADTPEIDLYEDYSCVHCAELAKMSDADMKKAVEDGKLIVNIHSLNFLDRGQDGHSTLAGASADALAQAGDAKAYWNLRSTLLEKQEEIYSKWQANDMADVAEALGAHSDAVKSIRDGSNIEHYKQVATEDAEQLKAADPKGQVSSPRVLQNGQDVKLTENWVEEVSAK
ncbi:DsbA family protein [Corynebacterium pyruviciproducens]|uniref:Thioredoxin domain-containing protein n=1 Tax=Corynebacterium pyruviciproducens TaxID=598660 RepID=A0AAF1BSA4_9CORY|nr:thioredoxin domain-containing protein [Corynebacterium pyruviciproducens]MDK6567223.1 thioredoxin domain-containing protein [Corynebacterium pyruviciproducens]WOT02583.1 thioredoxin domain-containing protein [Corynebacterium pyruviciproducens]